MGAVAKAVMVGVFAAAALVACTDLGGLSATPEAADAATSPVDGAVTTDAPVASGDAAADAGPPSCPSDALLCEDFEGTLPKWTSYDERGATCEVSMTRAAHGARSLRGFGPFVSDAGGNQNQCYLRHDLTRQTTGTLALRAYAYVAGPPPTGGEINLAWLHDAVLPSGCPKTDIVLGSTGKWNLGFYDNDVAIGVDSIDTVPTDRWFCMELVVDLAPAPQGHVRVYVDEAAVLDKDVAAVPNGFCGFGVVDLGLPGHATNGDAEVFLDDVVVASHRIGCR